MVLNCLPGHRRIFMSAHILVVEDDTDIQQLLNINLSSVGYTVSCVGDLASAKAAIDQHPGFDLIVLDLMLPDGDGLNLCQRLRGENCNTPIIILSAKGDEVERILGLEIGADDYISKPFSIRELLARIKSSLRRNDLNQQSQNKSREQLSFAELEIHINQRCVYFAGQQIDLTQTEFELLLYLAKEPGTVFSREQLLQDVWGYSHSGYEHTVNSHINRLRSKLDKACAGCKFIKTAWGVGYKFSLEDI